MKLKRYAIRGFGALAVSAVWRRAWRISGKRCGYEHRQFVTVLNVALNVGSFGPELPLPAPRRPLTMSRTRSPLSLPL